uniref:Uncharacterized protein n=1 Tax=Arundo donax TaxID=35708 RepID=A0A0A9C1F1_ARUDO
MTIVPTHKPHMLLAP